MIGHKHSFGTGYVQNRQVFFCPAAEIDGSSQARLKAGIIYLGIESFAEQV